MEISVYKNMIQKFNKGLQVKNVCNLKEQFINIMQNRTIQICTIYEYSYNTANLI